MPLHSIRHICETFPIFAINRIRMKLGVSRYTLLFIAGILWISAGANILRIGIVAWMNDTQCWWFKVAEATLVFLVFFLLIFRKLLNKHTRRIVRKREKSCPFSFFDLKSWIVMGMMIAFGITARRYGWLPNSFISFFYTGLSCALIITGILFLARGHALRTREAGKKSGAPPVNQI